MAITHWPEAERPREKMLQRGADSLSDAELLAIFLRTGVRGKTAVDLARDLMQHFGSLSALCAASEHELRKVPGIGRAKYVQFQAVLELARRSLKERLSSGDVLSSPAQVRDFLQLSLRDRQHEVFLCVFLDTQNRVIAVEELFQGTLTQASVYPREVVRRALQHNAAAVIFAHNHPSGVAQPSGADEALTRSLKQALALVEVRVLDHFIIGHGEALSFAQRGLL